MKKSVASESLFEFSNKRKPIKEYVDPYVSNVVDNEVDSEEDDEWVEGPEDQEIIDDIEKVELGDEIIVDDEDERVAKVEELDTNKTLLKQLKTIIDINKGKADREKNYVTFTLKGKPGEPIDGIPFDVKGNKDDTTIMFIRKGTKNVKMVPLKNIVLESKHTEEKYEMVRESLDLKEWSEYEYEPEADNYQDFLFKVANHLVQQWDQEVLMMLDIDEFPPEHEDLVVDVVNHIDEVLDDKEIDVHEMFDDGDDPEDAAEKIANLIQQKIKYGDRFSDKTFESKEEEDEYEKILKNLK